MEHCVCVMVVIEDISTVFVMTIYIAIKVCNKYVRPQISFGIMINKPCAKTDKHHFIPAVSVQICRDSLYADKSLSGLVTYPVVSHVLKNFRIFVPFVGYGLRISEPSICIRNMYISYSWLNISIPVKISAENISAWREVKSSAVRTGTA